MPGVGLHITSDHSIFIELSQDGGLYRVTRAALSAGYSHEPDRPVTAIRNAPLGEGIASVPGSLKKRGATVSVPSNEVMFRQIEVGSGTPAAIRALINMEVADLTSSASMLSGYQLLGGARGAPKALVGITREAMVNHLSASLRSIGVNTGGFAPAVVALYQCYLSAGDMDGSAGKMVVNLGDNSTDIIFVSGGDLLAARSINFGVRDIVEQLSSALGVNTERARETLLSKIDMRPGHAHQNVSGERAVSAVQDAVARLYSQLDGAMRYARAVTSGTRFASVAICGSGSTIKGLPQFLNSRFAGVSVEVMNPLAGFDTSKLDDVSRENVLRYAPALAVALGLAKINLNDSGSICFVPPAMVARKNFLQRSVWLYAACLLVVATLMATINLNFGVEESAKKVAGQASNAFGAYQSHASGLAERATSTNPFGKQSAIASLPEAKQKNLITQQRLIEFSDARLPGIHAMRLLADFTQALPSNVTLKSYQLTLTETPVDANVPGVRERRVYENGVLVEVFVAADREEPQVTISKLMTILEEHSSTLKVELGASPPPESDGSGQSQSYFVSLMNTDDLLDQGRESQ